jgi:hypothetical protein
VQLDRVPDDRAMWTQEQFIRWHKGYHNGLDGIYLNDFGSTDGEFYLDGYRVGQFAARNKAWMEDA